MGYFKGANMKLMKKAGQLKSPTWYQKAIKGLFECLTEDNHINCKHHEKSGMTDVPVPS